MIADIKLPELSTKLRELHAQAALAPPKVSAVLTQIHRDAAVNAFKNAYKVRFLALPVGLSVADGHRSLLAQPRDFPIEPGRDFKGAAS